MIYLRRVEGDSMLPSLKHGQIILAIKPVRLKASDVVIIRHRGIEKIKRLTKIRQGKIYVLGDNPARSTDSRTHGWLHESVVLARVIWPRF